MTGKETAGKKGKLILVFTLLFLPAFLLFIISRGCEMKFDKLEDFGPVNNYSFTDVQGKTYTQDDFKGDVILFTNIQENCLDSCSINLFVLDRIIYQHIRAKKSLKNYKIVTFVNNADGSPITDLKPTHDLIQDKIYKYNPEKWILVKGDAKEVFDFERNGENLTQAGGEFQELMMLVDKKNHLRMVLRGDLEGMFRRMKECIELLKKEYQTNNTNESSK